MLRAFIYDGRQVILFVFELYEVLNLNWPLLFAFRSWQPEQDGFATSACEPLSSVSPSPHGYTRGLHDQRARDRMARDNGHRSPIRYRRRSPSSPRTTLDLPPPTRRREWEARHYRARATSCGVPS
jgi:hypothetical protein